MNVGAMMVVRMSTWCTQARQNGCSMASGGKKGRSSSMLCKVQTSMWWAVNGMCIVFCGRMMSQMRSDESPHARCLPVPVKSFGGR